MMGAWLKMAQAAVEDLRAIRGMLAELVQLAKEKR